MKYRYAGWARLTTKDRWYQVCESHDYETCLDKLILWARDNNLRVTGSMVVLPFGVVPADPLTRKRKS